MLVTKNSIDEAIEYLVSSANSLGLDTETYGLGRESKLFSLQISDGLRTFYFNFNAGPDHNGILPDPECILDEKDLNKLDILFDDSKRRWYIHYARFDLQKLYLCKKLLTGKVHCTMNFARLYQNTLPSYSLDNCLKRIGMSKNDKVAEYIKEHKLFTVVKNPHKIKSDKLLHFDKVPLNIMVEYGESDAELVWKLGEYQVGNFKIEGKGINEEVIKYEYKLTKTLQKMENNGILLNITYTRDAIHHYLNKINESYQKIEEYTGTPYKNGRLWMEAILKKDKINFKINSLTGNPVFDKNALSEINHPVCKEITKIRHNENLVKNFYSAFLSKAIDGVLYSTINQASTETGRLSYSEPNCQNWPKEDETEEEFTVRKCFLPREDHVFVAIDYNQQEFRLLADCANESKLIASIMAGTDVHTATAEMLGISRKQAKTINFALIYGMGNNTLSEKLGIPLDTTTELKRKYFAALPRISKFTELVKNKASATGFVLTWDKRKLFCNSRQDAYKMLNHVIQGGCASIMRRALVELDRYLTKKRSSSKILLSIHDEVLFEVHRNELDIIPELQEIMENIYTPKNCLKLTCSVEFSSKSFAKKDMLPYGR